MRSFLGTLSLLVLGLWLGALVFFLMVVHVAREVLPPDFPDPASGIHAMGQVVEGSLSHLHYFGIVMGVLFLLFSLALRTLVRWHSVVPQVVLVIVMLGITCYSQFSIIPRMETAREAVGGKIAAVPENNPAREIFDRLHRLSTHLEGIVIVCGFVAFLLAGRPHVPRELV
ncbi:MAG: DUF4149 domain-containing protein [Acidobacteriaceae bacterium]